PHRDRTESPVRDPARARPAPGPRPPGVVRRQMPIRQAQAPVVPLPVIAPATQPATQPAPSGVPVPARFWQSYPGYRQTAAIDAIRAKHYGYLDRTGHTYLDYAGASLVADAQLHAHLARLEGSCFGNPHSESPASRPATELVEQARSAVLRF